MTIKYDVTNAMGPNEFAAKAREGWELVEPRVRYVTNDNNVLIEKVYFSNAFVHEKRTYTGTQVDSDYKGLCLWMKRTDMIPVAEVHERITALEEQHAKDIEAVEEKITKAIQNVSRDAIRDAALEMLTNSTVRDIEEKLPEMIAIIVKEQLGNL